MQRWAECTPGPRAAGTAAAALAPLLDSARPYFLETVVHAAEHAKLAGMVELMTHAAMID